MTERKVLTERRPYTPEELAPMRAALKLAKTTAEITAAMDLLPLVPPLSMDDPDPLMRQVALYYATLPKPQLPANDTENGDPEAR